MKKTILFTFAIMAAMIVTAAPKPELKSQIEAVQAKGVDYLLKNQMPNGSWMLHPAITGLAYIRTGRLFVTRAGSAEQAQTNHRGQNQHVSHHFHGFIPSLDLCDSYPNSIQSYKINPYSEKNKLFARIR